MLHRQKGLKLVCNDYDPTDVEMAEMEWIFYLSKAVDFADTGANGARLDNMECIYCLCTAAGWHRGAGGRTVACERVVLPFFPAFVQCSSSRVARGCACRSSTSTTTRYASWLSMLAFFLIVLRCAGIVACLRGWCGAEVSHFLALGCVVAERVPRALVAGKHWLQRRRVLSHRRQLVHPRCYVLLLPARVHRYAPD